MKICVDTNVLISATFWYGPSEVLLNKVDNKKIELVLSEEILSEFQKVLGYEDVQKKIKDKNLEMKYTAEKFRAMSTIVCPSTHFNSVKEDPSDNKILECAVEGKADFIVSQDKHLLSLGEFNGIKIVSPKEFLELLSDK